MGWDRGHRMSLRNILIQIASFAAWVIAMYSDLVVDKEMRACLCEFQETVLLSMQNACLEMVCPCSCEFPSTSLYPLILDQSLLLSSSHLSVPPFPKVSFASFVPFVYLIILFTTSQWALPGLAMKCARYDTA